MRQVAKKEWIKTSFWMPENSVTDKVEEKKQSDGEEAKMEVKKTKLKMMTKKSKNPKKKKNRKQPLDHHGGVHTLQC